MDAGSESLRVELSSPPDRDFLVANIMLGGQEFAEVNQEAGVLEIEVYARQDGEPWRLNYADLLSALNVAKGRLGGSRD